MSYFIGIDTVNIKRFENWHRYSSARLKRIFSDEEIDYCLRNIKQSAPRFAVRFAVKEAFLKALSNAFVQERFLLLTVCRHVWVKKQENGSVMLQINWHALGPYTATSSISLTHTDEIATGIVLLSDFAHLSAHHAVIRKI